MNGLITYGRDNNVYATENYIQDCTNFYCAKNLSDVMNAAHEALESGDIQTYNKIMAGLPETLNLEVNPA